MTAPPGDAAFATLKRMVVARTGHAYYEDKDPALRERLERRLRATGTADAAGYLALLGDPEKGEAEWAALESAVTIGETFFFRDRGQFDALRDTILPALIAARAASRRLRLWSAGCSTGAEPYSLAILLRRLLGEDHASWGVDILGTDISAAALEAARAAVFSPWALRGMDPAERARDFLPAEEGRAWQLRPMHRAAVRFERGNLLGLLDGTAPAAMTGFDLILCRNVLIYFDRAAVPRMVRALGARLAPDGWMLLGHAEPDPAFGAFLRPVPLAGTTAWRPRHPPPPAPWRPPAAAPPVPPSPPRPAPPAPSRNPVHDTREATDRARAEADAGALEAARATLREALRHHPTAAALHHLDGLAARALGDEAAAEAALRRAVYLDKDFVAAHYQLGLLLLGRDATAAGRRSIANAARLAGRMPPDAILEEGDGMDAGTLLGLARHHLGEGG